MGSDEWKERRDALWGLSVFAFEDGTIDSCIFYSNPVKVETGEGTRVLYGF